MGNWNRRYIARKKYSQNYQEPPPSPPGAQTNSVPSWEIDFCKSHGVAWRKVVTAKKYMFCHDNIVKWNDFAGEEAFHNSKKRYWAMINGLPRDNPLPDPDLYIDDIDWNCYIDPELLLDLDREYFNPDEVGKSEKLEIESKEVSSWSPVRDDKNARDSNPWESSCVQPTGIVKCTAQSWGQWDTPTKLKTFDNPWEQSCPQVDNSLENNAWRGSGEGSWGWHQGQDNTGQCRDIHNNRHMLWSHGSENVESMNTKGWGHVKHNAWSSNKRNMDDSRYPSNRSSHWGNNDCPGNAYPNVRQKGDWRNKSQGWRQPESRNDESRYMDFREQSRDGRAVYNGCRKREGSMQQALRYKSPRFQANDHGTAAYQGW